ncbi:innate immunity activator protein isoform X1 [Electrophorus electricus]|uniref:innate immunity activator protein isoform X1 n=1 Tax=Electrophorus electricus TaxID=8005 RepID=UPI0015CFCAD2|nr:innate immunity activator protein isoform X1 [Electrophorus electricus]XP_026885873.2 innate immunity activator protein isoform X1 [Electrophorus electricus]
MECKEEISDSDSGIILNSGPDSPTSPVKDLSTHTRAMRLKHQALEDRLEQCLLELKKLCIREAELTGKLSSDYPLRADEKPPQVRRRIGAAFKLDEGLIPQDREESELRALEADLALHQQIYEAVRRLSLEENLSKPVRKSRLQQCKHEERKVKELQEAVLKHHVSHGCVSPQTCCSSRQPDLCISDDSLLSDAVTLDDGKGCIPLHYIHCVTLHCGVIHWKANVYAHSATSMWTEFEVSPLSPKAPDSEPRLQCLVTHILSPSRGPLQASSSSRMEYEHSPVQNSPWRESSLDEPYEKHKQAPSSSSSTSSPTGTLTELGLADIPPAPQFVFKSLAMHNNHSNSAPSTPELPLRRHISQSFRLPRTKPDPSKPNLDLSRGRSKLPRRHVTDFALVYSVQRLYQCSSEDSSSEHSVSSCASSSSRDSTSEGIKVCPPPYGYRQYHAAHKAPGKQPSMPLPKNSKVRPTASSCQHAQPTSQSTSQPSSQDSTPLRGDVGKLNPVVTSLAEPVNINKMQQPDSTKRVHKPPLPYPSLCRGPSLKEHRDHPIRLLPREVVSNDLRSWHQRYTTEDIKPRALERHGFMHVKCLPNQEPPPYHQIQPHRQAPQKVILQRAPDGTPLQWYEEDDCEIVSQV